MPQLLSLCTVEPMLCSKRSHCHEKPAHYNQRRTPTYCNQRKPTCSNKDPVQWEKNLIHHDLMLFFSRSVVSDSMTPWTAAHQASLSFTISRSLLKFMSTESVMPSSHLLLCCPLLLPPSVFPSIRVFSNELTLHIREPKYGASASASVLPMNIQD